MIDIRGATDSDFEGIWRIFHAVVVEGGTYAFDPETTQEEAFRVWLSPNHRTYVATNEDVIVGTYSPQAEPAGARLPCRQRSLHGRSRCSGTGLG